MRMDACESDSPRRRTFAQEAASYKLRKEQLGPGVTSVTETAYAGTSPVGPILSQIAFASNTTIGPVSGMFAPQTTIALVEDLHAVGGSAGVSLSDTSVPPRGNGDWNSGGEAPSEPRPPFGSHGGSPWRDEKWIWTGRGDPPVPVDRPDVAGTRSSRSVRPAPSPANPAPEETPRRGAPSPRTSASM